MSRVLITGGAGRLGAAVARRLLADPAYDVRISDPRPTPQWMREGCEVHRGDLRIPAQAAAAAKACSHVIHMACFAPTASEAVEGEDPHALLEYESALHAAVSRAAIDRDVERFLFISSPLVFERAELFPTPEEHLQECLPPCSARGFARLAGERLCAVAAQGRELQYTICRPFGAYGPLEAGTVEQPVAPHRPPADLSELIERALAGERPLAIFGTGEQTLTPTHVEDLATGIVAALSAPAAANQDFNLSAERELSLSELTGLAWQAGTGEAQALAFERLPAREGDLARSYPSVAKARELLGWHAQIGLEEGIARIAASARERTVGTAALATAAE